MRGIGSKCETPEKHEHEVQLNLACSVAWRVHATEKPGPPDENGRVCAGEIRMT